MPATRFVWDPAGSDRELAHACVELRAGHYSAGQEILASCRTRFERRATTSLVLGSVAAGLDVSERWVAEEPMNPDALLLYARTATARALRSAETGDGRAAELVGLAERAGKVAAHAAARDPTPWVGLLALARLGRPPVSGPAALNIPGPWDLMSEIAARDPLNREGHHRLLSCFFARYGGSNDAMWQVAHWIAVNSPQDCALQVLPLAAYAEHFRAARDDPSRVERFRRQWTTEHALATSMHVYDGWFRAVRDQPATQIADLSLLAHALYAGEQIWEAAQVFRAMGPYAATHPWSLFGDPAEQLSRARARCGLRDP